VSTAAGVSPSRAAGIAANLALLLVLTLTAYIRFTVVERTEVISPYRADAREYFFSAYNLDHYRVFSSQVTWPPEQHPQAPPADAQVVPGYPLFLLLIGHPEPTLEYEHRITRAQAALSVLSVWLLYGIAARFLRRRWACLVALFAALSPHLTVFSTYVLSETLFCFLVLASVEASLRAIESGRHWSFLAVGVLWGISALVRPTTLFVVPLAWLIVFVSGRLKPWRAHACVLLLGFALALSPWWARNALLPPSHAESSKLVNFLLHGSYPDFMYDHNPESYGDPYRYDPRAAEYSSSVYSALAHIAQNFHDAPLTNLRWYLIGKPGFFLSWNEMKGAGDVFEYLPMTSPYFTDRFIDATHRISFWLHWPLMMLGLAGACLPWWRAQRWGLAGRALLAARLVSAIAFYAIGFHMIGAPYPRYGVPFRPLLYPLAMLALIAAMSAVSSRPEPTVESLQDAAPDRDRGGI
jgi:4-amino-4-deoxy-L-arabinose transferase-like glycosyltransferase